MTAWYKRQKIKNKRENKYLQEYGMLLQVKTTNITLVCNKHEGEMKLDYETLCPL